MNTCPECDGYRKLICRLCSGTGCAQCHQKGWQWCETCGDDVDPPEDELRSRESAQEAVG